MTSKKLLSKKFIFGVLFYKKNKLMKTFQKFKCLK